MKHLCVVFLACVTMSATLRPAEAAIRYHAPLIAPLTTPASNPPPSAHDDTLSENGVDPSSDKGRLIVAWIARISADPAIAGDVQRMSRLHLNPGARTQLLSDGLERLSPAMRLQYVAMIGTFLDTLVPSDCFGLTDMSDVVNRVSMNAMSESDIDRYFSILVEILRASASDATLDTPTDQQYAQAEHSLRFSLLRELGYLHANVARYTSYMQAPRKAAPVDACWAMRVMMHAVLAMPDPERDVVLRKLVGSPGARREPNE